MLPDDDVREDHRISTSVFAAVQERLGLIEQVYAPVQSTSMHSAQAGVQGVVAVAPNPLIRKVASARGVNTGDSVEMFPKLEDVHPYKGQTHVVFSVAESPAYSLLKYMFLRTSGAFADFRKELAAGDNARAEEEVRKFINTYTEMHDEIVADRLFRQPSSDVVVWGCCGSEREANELLERMSRMFGNECPLNMNVAETRHAVPIPPGMSVQTGIELTCKSLQEFVAERSAMNRIDDTEAHNRMAKAMEKKKMEIANMVARETQVVQVE